MIILLVVPLLSSAGNFKVKNNSEDIIFEVDLLGGIFGNSINVSDNSAINGAEISNDIGLNVLTDTASPTDSFYGIKSTTAISDTFGAIGVDIKGSKYGVYGNSTGDTAIYGETSEGYALHTVASSGWAGYLEGNVHITGNLTSDENIPFSNIFDQDLNRSSNVTHANMALTGNLNVSEGGIMYPLSGDEPTLVLYNLPPEEYTPVYVTPDSVANLVLWLDAGELGLNNLDPVSNWSDESGNGNDFLNVTAGTTPIFRTNQLNGEPAVWFNRTEEHILKLGSDVEIATVFVVANYEGGATFVGYDGLISPKSDDAGILGEGSKNDVWNGGCWEQVYVDGVDTYDLGTLSTHNIITGNTDGSTIVNDNWQLGQERAFSNRFWEGDILEVIGYDRELTEREMQNIEYYLSDKYGISVSSRDVEPIGHLTEWKDYNNNLMSYVGADGDFYLNQKNTGKLRIGGLPNDRSFAGVWLAQTTPIVSNYIFLGGVDGDAFFNAKEGQGMYFRIDNLNKMLISTDGEVKMPDVYSDEITGTMRDLYINASGQVGYTSSSGRYKENIRNLTDASWIYDLSPKIFDRKDGSSVDEYGLIAEEVEEINPRIVSYKRIETTNCNSSEAMYCERTFEITDEVETVNYGNPYMITALLTEIQNQKQEIEMLKSELCEKDLTYSWCRD